MCEVRDNHDAYEFYWGEQWDEFKQYLNTGLAPSAIVSSIYGWRKTMGDKKALARLFEACLEEQSANGTHPQWCEFTKRGFNIGRQGKILRGQYSIFREHAVAIQNENPMPQLWILKAQQSYIQVGIRMLSIEETDVESDETVLRWMNQAVRCRLSAPLRAWVKERWLLGAADS